jgi:hypothetical protein
MNNFWSTLGISVTGSVLLSGILVWLCREWISARLRKSIQHEYDVKLEGFKAGYQKVLDENRIAFSWWHNAQAKAIQETYSHIAELSFSIDNKLSCAAQQPNCSDCDSAVKESYKKAKKTWEVNKVFFEEALNQKLTEIFSISWDIKSTVNQTNACFHQRQNLLEHCRQNKNQIDTLLVELRKELRTIMSGGKINE